MKNRNSIIKTLVSTAIGMTAGIIAIAAPAAPALADDTVPVIDMGTFENSYEPTDSWIKDGWEYEKKDDYIVLKKYTGDDVVVEVPGKVTISGTTYKVKICDETFEGNNRITEVDFKTVDGQKVTVEGDLNGAFAGDTLLKTLDLSGFDPTGVTDYTDIFKVTADTQLTIKNAQDSFINAVAPILEDQNRYLGTVKVTAKVTLTGKTLAANQFNFRLYKDSVNESNLIKDKDGRQIRVPYQIRVFNTIDFNKSHHYNPLAYVHSEKDILKLVTVLMENTKGDGKEGDPFWNKAERLLLTAYIGYMVQNLKTEDRTFANLIEMLDHSQVKEDDEGAVNGVDLLFQESEKKDPGNFAARQYKKYKLAAGKTSKSILISCAARLAPFDIAELRELTAYDEMELDLIGDRLTALFIIISDTDDTFNFLAAMMYSQLFNLLCEKADNVYKGHLPVHVRCILDEFPNTGKIPNFEKLIATIRSREISASVILQSMSQLKAIYKESSDTICGNCDTLLFLGGKEKTTLKEMSETLGKETIDLFNTSDTRGSSQSMGHYAKDIKALLVEKNSKLIGEYSCQGYNTFGPFKLVGGTAKGHPTEDEISGAVHFYETLL